MKFIKNIIFDVDSTLVAFEGLDFIAAQKGKQRAVEHLTVQAMNGQLPMREAMEVKLKAIQPNFFDFVELGGEYVRRVMPGARVLINRLKKEGCQVWILTGNFQPAVGILANFLGIPLTNVITNEIWFDERGNYAGFNLDHPLSNNDGKAAIIRQYGQKLADAVMIGDSFTDLDTQSVVKKFIGFGGVVKRPIVAEKAAVYLETLDFTALAPHLQR